MGEQSRTVICTHGNQKVNDAYCSSLETKPPERMGCNVGDCPLATSAYSYYSRDHSPSAYLRSDLKSSTYTEEIMGSDYDSHEHSGEQHFTKTTTLMNKTLPPGEWQSGDWSSVSLNLYFSESNLCFPHSATILMNTWQ